MIHTIRLLCLMCFALIILSAIFLVLYFSEHKEAERWRSIADNMAEAIKIKCEKADLIEKENNNLNKEIAKWEIEYGVRID